MQRIGKNKSTCRPRRDPGSRVASGSVISRSGPVCPYPTDLLLAVCGMSPRRAVGAHECVTIIAEFPGPGTMPVIIARMAHTGQWGTIMSRVVLLVVHSVSDCGVVIARARPTYHVRCGIVVRTGRLTEACSFNRAAGDGEVLFWPRVGGVMAGSRTGS